MGEKSDLKVDYDLLVKSEGALTHIKREFRKCGNRQDELAEDVGAKTLESAMHEFADNWKDNRQQMLQNVEDVLKLVTKARESFEGLEQDLVEKVKVDDKRKK
ncbi:hypothetical protein AB0P36_21900 [Streptomyces flavidovirens]|uniref:hypothetical protein n=1 Tax=Streptomyces flavidovirens TaxID=67298 RepID=UPI003429C73F